MCASIKYDGIPIEQFAGHSGRGAKAIALNGKLTSG
jgi:hypothetical protein